MASDERGTKRTCPVTGKKFYDLGKDPVVSPYTGKSYPLSFFEAAQEKAAVKFGAKTRKGDDADAEDETEDADIDVAAQEAGAEVISLDDAEDADDDNGDDEDIPDVEDVEVDEELGGDDDDTFLETDDEDEEIDFDVEVDEDER